MRISRLSIQNFRSIKSLDLELDETTVLIGPNNAGKTAVLEALRIALTRKWGQRGTGFSEYDIHLADETADPKTSPGIAIEIRVEESVASEWPDTIQQDLDDIVQVNAATGITSINLRVSCSWNIAEEAFVPTWEFLNAARQPLRGASARRTNLERFWQYLPVFYLGALRDADDEFSPKSQFWGRLLKAVRIPPNLEAKTQRIFNRVNKRLLDADPKLANIAETLSGATKISRGDGKGAVALRLLPLKTWDLLSKAEIILRNESAWPWLPLTNHGQGVQSLSVLFLFQAFVDHLLEELYGEDSNPVLALEEPETHLHPQAARTLWTHISKLSGQRIITTHSPYFVQKVPFRSLRLLRLTPTGTEVRWLASSYSATVPASPDLPPVVARFPGTLSYDNLTHTLKVVGKLEEGPYRRLLACYGKHAERGEAEDKLRDLRARSNEYISDQDLRDLDTFARRIRGEIFFAAKWMIVEGQAEHLLVSAIADALDYPLDDHGVALIDSANVGNPQSFAALARALAIPWVAVFDGDQAGHDYKQKIVDRGFEAASVEERCKLLPAGNLEQQLVEDGLEAELRAILVGLGKRAAGVCTRDELLKMMGNCKMDYAGRLAIKIEEEPAIAGRILEPIRNAIQFLRGAEC